jgi:hypothetical protein
VKRISLLGIAALMVLAFAGIAQADVVLNDLNSTLKISGTGQGSDPDRRGVFEWQVDGVNQLYQQWWWYRVGTTGREYGIESLTLINEVASSNYLEQTYSDPQGRFDITVKWALSGGPANSGWSDVAETARVVNKQTVPLDFHLFEYSDFDLENTPSDNIATYIDTVAGAFVTQNGGMMTVTESAINRPHRWEIAFFDSIRSRLDNNVADNLMNTGSGLGPGDLTWALQWDVTIPVGGSLHISKDKLLKAIPEWNSLFLAAIGMVGTIGIRRRRR